MVLTRIQAKRPSLFDVKPCKCWSSTFESETPQIFREKAEHRLSVSLQELWCILPNPFHFLILLSWKSIKSGSACFVCVWTLSRELIWVFFHHHDSQPFASITVRFFQTFFHNFSVTVLDTVSSVSTISTSQKLSCKTVDVSREVCHTRSVSSFCECGSTRLFLNLHTNFSQKISKVTGYFC